MIWSRLQNFYTASLRRRLLISVAGIHAVMMSVFIWDLTQRQQDMLLGQQSRLATALSQSVATSTALWIQARDLAGLQEIVEAQKRYPELLFAMVTSLEGEILAHTDVSLRGQRLLDLPGSPQTHTYSRRQELVDVAVPALVAGRHVGWVRVGVVQAITHAELDRIILNGVLYTVAAIAIGALLAALMARQMTRRLDLIQQTAGAVQTGHRGQRARLDGHDEAAVLARQFNHMLDALEENRYRLDIAQHIAKLGNWEMDLRDGTQRWSEQIFRIFELPQTDDSPRFEQILEVIHPEDRPFVQAAMARLRESHDSFELTHRLCMPDGRIKHVHVVGQARTTESGHTTHMVGMVQDISELKEAQLALAAQRDQLEEQVQQRTEQLASQNRLFAAISRMQEQFIREADPTRMFRRILEEFVLLTGSDNGFICDLQRDPDGKEYLRDYAFHNIPQNAQAQQFYEAHKASNFMFRLEGKVNLFNQVISTRQAVFANNLSSAPQRPIPAGHPPLHAFVGIPVMHGDRMVGEIGLSNRPGGYDQALVDRLQPALAVCGQLIVARWDRQAREQAEAQLHEAKEKAEMASDAKSQFLANMSHELRTPLNAILGMLYLALRNDLPPNLHNQLSKARTSAQSLLGLINDILDLSKIEAGKLEIEHVEFGLDSVLERVTDIVADQATAKEVEFLVRYDSEIPATLIGDPLRLGQVLINLCANAVKFTERGEVELSFQIEAKTESRLTLRVCVRDTGMGITPEQQQRLFQKFSQADLSSTRRFGGSGLGLAISKNLVEIMGGRIWLENSEPDRGSTFCISIPLDVSDNALPQHHQRVARQAETLLRNRRVLVVDDNDVSREILSSMLRNFRLTVDTERSGAAALAKLEAAGDQQYDIVLMDWRMPGMSGDEVIRKLRRSPEITRQPKLVMVTAYGREDVLNDAVRSGADGFLVKPVSPSALLDALLNALGQPDPEAVGGQRQALQRRSRAHDLAGIRLLLVEDNDINREFAGEFLRSLNIEVDTAVHGAEALDRIQQHPYDCILMDIHMPVMDGLEATRRIRRLAQTAGDDRYARIPIIAMTALAMAQDVEKSLASGMNDHVSKPINPEGLITTLGKWVSRPTSLETVRTVPALDIPPDLVQFTTLDARQGVHRIGGNPEAYRRQLLRFRDNYRLADQALIRLIEKEGLAHAESYCHALKGVTGNIGAVSLHTKITEIDDLLKVGKPPGAAQLHEMANRLQAVIRDIDTLEAGVTTTAPAAAAAPPIDHAELVSRLKQLEHALTSDLGAAEPLLQKLRPHMAGTPWEQSFSQIDRLIDTFDTSSASEQLGSLLRQILTS